MQTVNIPDNAVYVVLLETTDSEVQVMNACIELMNRYAPDDNIRRRIAQYLYDRFVH